MSKPSGFDQFAANNRPEGLDEFIAPEMREEEYGSLPQQALTAVEGAARGISLGASDYVASKLTSPESVRARQETNPLTSIAGDMAGGAGLLALTGGLAAPAEAALAVRMAPTAARVIGYGLEGAAFGAGHTISDLALGDTNVNAEKILMDLGTGFALGGGLGLLSKGLEALPLLKKSAPVIEESETVIPKMAESAEVKTPSSIEELEKLNENAKYMGMDSDKPAPKIQALDDATSRLHLDFPVHNLQKGALAEPEFYNTARELPTEQGKAIRQYEANQRKELNYKTEKSIQEVAPESKLLEDSRENGQQAIDTFSKQYQDEKDSLIPALKQIKEYETKDPFSHKLKVIDTITKEMPELSRMFDTSGKGIQVNPYKTSYGFDKATYNATKQMVEALEEPAYIKELLNIRKGLDQNIDIMAQGQAPGEIRRLKAVMMDYIQSEVEKVDPLIRVAAKEGEQGATVRDVFKRYAINEQQREVIEKAFGASVGSQEFGALSKIKNEKILDKIFSNTATVQAAKNILPKEEFNKMLANYLAQEKAFVTTDGVLSTAKFGTFLNKSKGDVLNEAFSDRPSLLQKIRDLNTVSRIVPDKPSVNPSGTAKTLWSILEAHSVPEMLSNAKKFGLEKFEQKAVADELNARLADRAHKAEKMGVIEKIIKKSTDKIDKATKSVYSGAIRGAAITGASKAASEDYSERVKKVKELSEPSAMMNHFENSTAAMQAAAPNITSSLNQAMVRGVEFLNSKIPAPHNQFVLSGEFKPSAAAKDKFNHYYDVVNDPLISLDELKSGVLTNDTMEALKTVHPNLLVEMQKGLLNHFNDEEAKDLPYPVKISLSKFLGQPLDETMTPQSIIGYQASLSGPQQSQQGIQSDRVTQKGLQNLDLATTSKTQTDPLDA